MALSLAERFWSKVRKTPECWFWEGSIKPNGYGIIHSGRGKILHAHRVSWELHFGVLLPGFCVCHHCDVRPCVRPDHLFTGTHSDNMRDCVAKGRHRSGFPPNPTGEKAYRAKLTLNQVVEIRQLRESGMSGMKIAKLFPVVGYQQIYRICSGEKWP
jgi:hypothetical protein